MEDQKINAVVKTLSEQSYQRDKSKIARDDKELTKVFRSISNNPKRVAKAIHENGVMKVRLGGICTFTDIFTRAAGLLVNLDHFPTQKQVESNKAYIEFQEKLRSEGYEVKAMSIYRTPPSAKTFQKIALTELGLLSASAAGLIPVVAGASLGVFPTILTAAACGGAFLGAFPTMLFALAYSVDLEHNEHFIKAMPTIQLSLKKIDYK